MRRAFRWTAIATVRGRIEPLLQIHVVLTLYAPIIPETASSEIDVRAAILHVQWRGQMTTFSAGSPINRREFLRHSGRSAGAVALGAGALLQGCQSLPSMPEPEVRPTLKIPHNMDVADALLTAGAAELDLGSYASRGWGYDATLPGPTLRARVGERARIGLLNQLAEETTIHWHGMVVPTSMDGHPADAVPPGAGYTYDYPIVQRAAMNWYHPHPHGGTGRQIWRGLAGALIVEDPIAEQGLPSGDREIPLLLRDGLLDGSGQLEYRRRNSGMVGDFPLVNGVPYPSITLAPALHRFRLLNAANARVFRLGTSNATRLILIGNDGGLLEQPLELDTIELGPAERVDVLIDLSDHATGTTMALRCHRAGWDLLGMRIAGERDRETVTPSAFSPIPRLSVGPDTQRRTFRFEGHRRINGREYRMDEVDFRVPMGETEIWEFESSGGAPHPVHVHGAHFQVMSRSGGRGRVFPWEQGWKDTVLLEDRERVEIAIRFDTYSGVYLLHCHKLEHEDAGMMLNFEVT
ncbi:MAG: multicopper oxidase domain-containing protein [Gemmatimonas sp.]|nr:multicopper oxidase domain-containing protein [Gemmatimonas sp.]